MKRRRLRLPPNGSAASGAPKPAFHAATSFTPVSGEVLEFTGSVAKVSNVASLRLVVNGRKEVAGKDAWHLQAFCAHSESVAYGL